MRSLIITFFILILVKAVSSQSLRIPFGSNVVNDGIVNQTEWADADTVLIQSSPSHTTSVLYKHDGLNLNVAFVGNLQTPSFYFPEVNVDPMHDQATSFQQDDWWFHVSATDCESQGSYGNYSNCQSIRPNWLANPNFGTAGQTVNKVEISIPLQTLGLSLTDTIGLLFFLNNFQNFRYHQSTANHLDPSSWTSAYFEPVITSLEQNDFESIRLWPNPTDQKLNIDLIGNRIEELILRNLGGEIVLSYSNLELMNQMEIDLSSFPSSIYFLEMRLADKIYRKKIIRN